MPWPPLPRRPWLLPKAISRRARPPYRVAVGAKGGIGATRRGATVGGRAAWGGEGAKLGCLATSRWPLPCWPRARGRGTVDGIGTQEREPQERVRHREGGGLRSRVLEPAAVLDLLGPAVTATIVPLIFCFGLASLYTDQRVPAPRIAPFMACRCMSRTQCRERRREL